jgi:hypothetical protein
MDEISEEDPQAPKLSVSKIRQQQLEIIEISAPDDLDLSAAVQRKRDRKSKQK